MKKIDKGKSQILQNDLLRKILHIVGWCAGFFGLGMLFCLLLMNWVTWAKEFATAAFVIGLITFFLGIFSITRGSSQDFNPWSYLGSRCVQSMQDPGNDNYAKQHLKESIIVLNEKGIALTIAGIAIFFFSFF